MEPEPWLRGPVAGLDPLLAPLVRSFEQAREDLARHTEGLTTEQLWAKPYGLGPAGFHLRHIAGSVDRLVTYLEGRALSDGQLAELAKEKQPGAGRDELLAGIDSALRRAEAVIRKIEAATFAEPREVGRRRLPTTVIGLLVHIAEHTQRHVGQAIAAAKLARAKGSAGTGPHET